MTIHPRYGIIAVSIICAIALVPAFFIEPFKSLAACHLCMVQRAVYFTIFGVSIIHLISHNRNKFSSNISFKINIILAISGLSVSLRQIWLQYFNSGLTPACLPEFPSLIDQLPLTEVIELVFGGTGDCSKIQWDLFGISIAGYSALFFCCIISSLIIYKHLEFKSK